MEFLDFNSIEDLKERKRVRSFLNAISLEVQLPWKVTQSNGVDHQFVEINSTNYQKKHFGNSSDSSPIVNDDNSVIQPNLPLSVPINNNGLSSTPAVPQIQENGATTKTWSSLFNKNSKSDSCEINGNQSSNGINGNNNNEEFCPIRSPGKAQFIDPRCYRMGEFLLSYKPDNRSLNLPPKGLINKSNYCYINSILQALLACPPMCNLLNGLSQQNQITGKQLSTPVIDGMCRFIKAFQPLKDDLKVNHRNSNNSYSPLVNYDKAFEPTWIHDMLTAVKNFSFLNEGRQEDAEEFLGLLLNGLNDEMLNLMELVKNESNNLISNDFDNEYQNVGPKNKKIVTRYNNFKKTPINEIFGGILKSRIHRTDDTVTDSMQPFFTLQLNIKKVNSIHEALEALVSKNQLEGVISTKTNKEVEAWQQVTLHKLPIVLVMHLERFDFRHNGCRKIVKTIKFPILLQIDSKLLSSNPDTAKERQYKLFAVVYHDGEEATKGHYTTDTFHVGYNKWLRFNDSCVKPVQEEEVLNPHGNRVPYLLFYRRINTNSK